VPVRPLFRVVATFGLAAAALAATGAAGGQAPGQKTAYEYALKCWAVAGYIASDPEIRRNPEGLARTKASGERAYNAAMKMGELLGYERTQIADDLDAAGRLEGALMLRDRSYFERTRAACDQLGLG
jgi:hypothetical protein